MVLDTSAVAAILFRETEAPAIAASIEGDPVRLVSAVNWIESQIVLNGRFGPQGGTMADSLFRELRIEVVPLDAVHAQTALSAWQRYGKGRHPAGLNLGDCCAYATAILKNQKLLFKGKDFSATDVARVEY